MKHDAKTCHAVNECYTCLFFYIKGVGLHCKSNDERGWVPGLGCVRVETGRNHDIIDRKQTIEIFMSTPLTPHSDPGRYDGRDWLRLRWHGVFRRVETRWGKHNYCSFFHLMYMTQLSNFLWSTLICKYPPPIPVLIASVMLYVSVALIFYYYKYILERTND